MARATRDEWAKRVEAWSRSGLSGRDYAERAGVNANTLKYWKRMLRLECDGGAPVRAEREPERVSFVELVSKASPHASTEAPAIEVVLGSGAIVRVPSSFDDGTLRRVIAIVGGR